MVSTEQYFPRGGIKPKESFNERKKFDFLGNADRIGKKKKYRAPKIIPEPEDDDHLSDVSYDSDEGIKSVSAEAISPETLREGMIILGRVMEIFDTKVIISLPGKLTGVVMACHISSTYTKLLKDFVDDEIEEIKRLPEMLSSGEYVNVRVLSANLQKGQRNVTLSMMPQDVNKGTFFNTIKEGMLLRGAIDSKEDHGFVVDLGIPNSRTFLPAKLSDESFNIELGQVIWCVVKKCQVSSTNSIVTVSNSLESIQSALISGDNVSNYQVTDLRPGMAVNFHVNKPLSDGAEGSVLANGVGYIHVSQIGAKVRVGTKVKARLLYVMPITKFAFFTTRKIFESLRPNLHDEANIKVGQIINNAQVTKVTANYVIFKFAKAIGIMNLKQSAFKRNSANEEYPIGSQHTIRIIHYHPSDYAYLCSDKPEFLEQKYFNMNELSVGEIVDAVVENVLDKGISVKLGNIKGWIPDVHVSEVGLFHSKKSNSKVSTSLAMKKFKPEQVIKARVLKINMEKSSLHLTAKPTLLNPDLVILSNYEDAKVGYQYKGVIVHHLQHGVLVSFFGEVKAIVNKKYLSNEFVTNIPESFLLGQVVNCTILSADIEHRKLFGSFIDVGLVDENVKSKKNKKSKKRKNSETIIEDMDNSIEEMKQKKTEESVTTKKKKKDKNNSNDNVELDMNTSEENVKKRNKKSKEKNKTEEIEISLPTCDLKKTKKDKNKKIEETNSQTLDNKTNGNAEGKRKKRESLSSDQNYSIEINKKNKKLKPDDESIKTEVQAKKDKKTANKEVANSVNTEVKGMDEPKFSSIGNFWNLNASTISKNVSKGEDGASSSDSETEKVEEKTKKKKRLTTAEKVEKARREEEDLRDIERQLVASDSQPQSSDQFERLLLANPNSSELWIAYMAFHLQATEIERARTVGRKALKTISFREEQDKLNVWLAMLNIENRFGTQESLTYTLQEALQMNNPFDVHSKMLGMYLDTGKVDDLQSLVDTMVTKYRHNPQTYILTGEILYKVNLVEKARSVMQKAITRLENKAHIPVLIKFAHMENNHGDSERAEALFEQIVGAMPQRVDIWCVYADMLLKSQKIDSLRLVFERAITQKLPLRKMKTLYKKWVEIEEKLGNTEQVERIRQMAVEFINKVKL